MTNENLFLKARELRNSGQFEASLKILLELHEELPNEVKYLIYIGASLGDLDKEVEAIPYHQSAVRMCPQYNIASLGLFHSLWNLYREQEALMEAVRFDSLYRTTVYVDILSAHVKLNFVGVEISNEAAAKVVAQVANYPKAYRPPVDDDFDIDGQGKSN